MKNIDTYKDRYLTKGKRQNRLCMTAIAFAVTICIGAVNSVHNQEIQGIPDHSQLQMEQKRCTECHDKEMEMAQFFSKHGSPEPKRMAQAVFATKRPKIMAKIAVTETNGNPHKRAYGFNKAHDGAFGVNRKDWGKVSKNPTEQALQAELALDTFLKEKKNMKTALNAYGGDVSFQTYADKILGKD
jgi:hypothetical protein